MFLNLDRICVDLRWHNAIYNPAMGAELLSYAEADAVVAAYARELRRAKPAVERIGPERISLTEALGRVLAAPIVADQNQPPFTRSTRDGFACRAAEASAHRFLPVAGSTHAGGTPTDPLPTDAAWEIMTGAPVPDGADAVVMLEHVERKGEQVRLLPDRTIKAGDNVVKQGTQARRGDVLVGAGVEMGAAQIALAASCGYAELAVYKRPRVAILTTGDELVEVDRAPGSGQIRNSNAPMLAALVAKAGGEPWVLPTAADTAEALDAALGQAFEADMLLVSGGVSAGKFDLVEPALEQHGAKFYFTGVRMQPGKPLVFGALRAADSPIPFFGLPGNPISSAATFLLFGAQIVQALAGRSDYAPQFLSAQLAKETDRKGRPGLTRFLPGRWAFGAKAGVVETVPWQGSGDLAAFARSNCFVVIPEDTATLDAGAIVRILMI